MPSFHNAKSSPGAKSGRSRAPASRTASAMTAGGMSIGHVLSLQRTVGNRTVQRLLAGSQDKIQRASFSDSIAVRTVKIISELLGVSEVEITPGSSLVNDLGADAQDRDELAMALESEFEIDIPDEQMERLSTVQDLIGFIRAAAKG